MEVLRQKEAVEEFKLSLRTLQYAASRGEIPVIKVGRSTRYDRADLMAWLQSKKGCRDNGD